jgi:branched-chain amino acid transport system ATP-binding protein
MLYIDGLTVKYGYLTALEELSAEVGRGETVCFLGPNGAGKSTLLLTVAGVLTPSSGTVQFEEEIISGLTPEQVVRKGVSVVPEGRHIFGTLTVKENLLVGTGIRTDKHAIKTDFERILSHFPILHERINMPAGKLSGGEQQMLAISRALLTNPKLIAVDEPSLGLAPLVVDQLYKILMNLQANEALTLLLVEQTTHRALAASERIYVLRNGRIKLAGHSRDFVNNDAITRAYFGFNE